MNDERDGHLQRFMTRAGARNALLLAAFAIALVIAVVALGRELEHHLGAVEAWIASLGPWGPIAFVALFILATSALVPDTLLCIVAGALFGMAWGAAAVVAGAVLAGAAQYALSRRLLRARVERALSSKPSLAAIQRAVRRDELRLQLLIRLTPLSPAMVSYMLGAAGVRFIGFMLAGLAVAPGVIVEVYLGHAARHVARAASDSATTSRLHDVLIVGGVVLCIVVMTIVARTARRALVEAVNETDDVAPAPA